MMQHMMHTHQCQKQCIKQARRGRQARRGWPRKASGPRGRRPAGGALRKRVRVLPRVGQHLARQRGQVAEQVQGCRARRRPRGRPPLRAATPARRMRMRRRSLAGRTLRRRALRLSAPAVPCYVPGPGSQYHSRQSRQDIQGRHASARGSRIHTLAGAQRAPATGCGALRHSMHACVPAAPAAQASPGISCAWSHAAGHAAEKNDIFWTNGGAGL